MRSRKHNPTTLLEQRGLESVMGDVDFTDPRYPTANQIHGILRGNNCIQNGKRSIDVIALIMRKLPEHKVTQTTLAPELIELKRQELEHKRTVAEFHKQAAEARDLRAQAGIARGISFDRQFFECAKLLLATDDFTALVAMANTKLESEGDA